MKQGTLVLIAALSGCHMEPGSDLPGAGPAGAEHESSAPNEREPLPTETGPTESAIVVDERDEHETDDSSLVVVDTGGIEETAHSDTTPPVVIETAGSDRLRETGDVVETPHVIFETDEVEGTSDSADSSAPIVETAHGDDTERTGVAAETAPDVVETGDVEEPLPEDSDSSKSGDTDALIETSPVLETGPVDGPLPQTHDSGETSPGSTETGAPRETAPADDAHRSDTFDAEATPAETEDIGDPPPDTYDIQDTTAPDMETDDGEQPGLQDTRSADSGPVSADTDRADTDPYPQDSMAEGPGETLPVDPSGVGAEGRPALCGVAPGERLSVTDADQIWTRTELGFEPSRAIATRDGGKLLLVGSAEGGRGTAVVTLAHADGSLLGEVGRWADHLLMDDWLVWLPPTALNPPRVGLPLRWWGNEERRDTGLPYLAPVERVTIKSVDASSMDNRWTDLASLQYDGWEASLGVRLTAQFDLTGDGEHDLVRWTPNYTTSTVDNPVNVYPGPLDSIDLAHPDGRIIQTGSDNFREVAVGDLTGDGVADLVWRCLRCPTGLGFWPGPITGMVDVNEHMLHIQLDTTTLLQDISVGDVSGDEIADLLISLWVDQRGGVPRTEALLFLGPLSGAPLAEADADLRVTSRHTLDQVEIVGDMTGDGINDITAKADYPVAPMQRCDNSNTDYVNRCNLYKYSIYILNGTLRGSIDADTSGLMVTTATEEQVDTFDTAPSGVDSDAVLEPGRLSWLISHTDAGDVDGDGVGDLFLQTAGTSGNALMLLRGCGTP